MTEVTRELRIAVAAEYKKLAAEKERAEKAVFLLENKVGDRRTVYDGDVLVGSVSIPKPSVPKPEARIVDESVVIPWVLEHFGPGVVEEVPASVRLSEQGRKSALAAAESGDDVPGVDVVTPAPRVPYAKWVPERGVDAGAVLAGMAARGVFDVASVLAVEPAKPGEPA